MHYCWTASLSAQLSPLLPRNRHSSVYPCTVDCCIGGGCESVYAVFLCVDLAVSRSSSEADFEIQHASAKLSEMRVDRAVKQITVEKNVQSIAFTVSGLLIYPVTSCILHDLISQLRLFCFHDRHYGSCYTVIDAQQLLHPHGSGMHCCLTLSLRHLCHHFVSG